MCSVKNLLLLGVCALAWACAGPEGSKTEKADEGTKAKPTTVKAAAGSQPLNAATSQPLQAASSQPTKTAGAQPMKAQPKTARVFFRWPDDGAKIPTTSKVLFGLEGMSVSPAGAGVEDPKKGHHHLIIDGGPIPYGSVVPMDEKHLHFGKGQLETTIALNPGKHTLTMQFADGAHRSFGKPLSATINVEVVPVNGEPEVRFAELKDGAKVKSPLPVKMVVNGLTVKPAGEAPTDKTSGHHHIIVDGQPIPIGEVVPNDAKHIHFGKGQTEAKLDLSPGAHTLTLQFADGAHRSYGKEMSSTVKITVEK